MTVLPDNIDEVKKVLLELSEEERASITKNNPLLMLLYEKLWILVIAFLLPFLWSFFILLLSVFGSFAEYCGISKGCDEVSKSVFGYVFGIPLYIYGAFFYAIPLLIIWGISRSKERVSFLNLFQCLFIIYPVILGAEIYLIYSQFVLSQFCPFCTIMALLSFIPVVYLGIKDFAFNYWNFLFRLPRWSVVLAAFLAFHFIQHPKGSYFSSDSPEAMKRIDMAQKRMALRSEIYAKPFEVDGMRERSKTAVMVAPPLNADNIIREFLKKDKTNVVEQQSVIDFNKRGDGQYPWVGKDIKPSQTELANNTVYVKNEIINTTKEYDYNIVMKNRIVGPDDAPIKFVMYYSYGCATCRHYDKTVIDKIRLSHQDKISVEYRYHKLSSYPYADMAAISSALASLQGPMVFENVHRSLFENFEEWSKSGDVFPYVEKHVDFKRFVNDMNNFKMLGRMILAESKKNSDEDKVESVPLLLIYVDGKLYRRVATFVRHNVVEEIVQAIFREKKYASN